MTLSVSWNGFPELAVSSLMTSFNKQKTQQTPLIMTRQRPISLKQHYRLRCLILVRREGNLTDKEGAINKHLHSCYGSENMTVKTDEELTELVLNSTN